MDDDDNGPATLLSVTTAVPSLSIKTAALRAEGLGQVSGCDKTNACVSLLARDR